MLKKFIDTNLITSRGHVNPHICKAPEKWFRRNNSLDVLKSIIVRTAFLDKDVLFKERIFCIRNDINSAITCARPGCNNSTNFHNSMSKYQNYCSMTCRSNSEDVKEKTKKTCMDKFGADNISKSETGRKLLSNSLKGNEKTILANKRINFERNYKTASKKIKDANLAVVKFDPRFNGPDKILKCNVCEEDFRLGDYPFLTNGLRCPFCFPKRESAVELKICHFLDELGIKYIRNDRKTFGVEVDILILESKLAIEVDGVLWHSFGTSKYSYIDNAASENKNVHLRKNEILTEHGFTLLRFTDLEIKNDTKFAIIKSLILGKIGKHKKIFARKCKIETISQQQLSEFLDKNHLNGSSKAPTRFGLFYGELLVMVISFGKRRFAKSDAHELYRLCSLRDHTIVGGFSKLLSHSKRVIETDILSFIDRRFSDGRGFKAVGFELVRATPPNYFYWHHKTGVVFNRYKAQKHKLKTLLGDSFKADLTETQNMYNSGYRKFYDCGNYVFELKKS